MDYGKTDPTNTELDSQPQNYKQMDKWLNALSSQEWKAIIGAYAEGGYGRVIELLKQNYRDNMSKWSIKDLSHYLHSRTLSDFKGRGERGLK